MAIGALIVAGATFCFSPHGPRSHSDRTNRDRVASTPPIQEKSIAASVSNLSDDKSNAYFSEGIQDETYPVVGVAAPKVISRTSTMKYKSEPKLKRSWQTTGRGAHVEGSVQKVANAVKVNVQLICAATDEHLWAESYNRKLDDVFEWKARLPAPLPTSSTPSSPAPSKRQLRRSPLKMEAYDVYLRGRNR
jgi:TolB-like protein